MTVEQAAALFLMSFPLEVKWQKIVWREGRAWYPASACLKQQAIKRSGSFGSYKFTFNIYYLQSPTSKRNPDSKSWDDEAYIYKNQ